MSRVNKKYDAVVVGLGPNGLAAAITLARAGKTVLGVEAGQTVGGGLRSKELTKPGYIHDLCAAVHPLAVASPFLRTLDLERHGLKWIQPPAPLAHAMTDEPAVIMERSLEKTAEGLMEDRDAYMKIFSGPVRNWDPLARDLLRPLSIPRRPFTMMRLGPLLMRSAISAANSNFRGRRAKALFAGNSAHSIMPLHRPFTAAFGVMLGMLGHGVGWPIARGGAQSIADALVSVLITRGGEIRTNTRIDSLDQLPEAELIFLDMAPRRIAEMEGLDFPASYLDNLRTHAQGPGVFKIDWALDNPIPWKDHNCLSAASVHLGGPIEEVVESEAKAWEEKPSERPFVLLSQPTLFDRDRAPEGKHIGWAYCHVPNGCEMDMTDRIENRIEEFAPGFKNRIIARHVMFPGDMEAHNPNYVGGDIAGGVQGFRELFLKPLGRWRAYETPLKGVYICSSSMPPGAGVHGMCGHLAATMALKSLLAG